MTTDKAAHSSSRRAADGSDTLSHPADPGAGKRDRVGLDLMLVRLRWFAVAGHVLAIGIVHWGIGMPLPLLPLATGVATLIAINLLTGLAPAALGRWRSLPLPWLLVDTLVLGWQLYWSGGPANPFVSLLMVPIALAAVALPARAVVATGSLAVVAYSVLWFWHRPLPHVHGEFDLHLFGMWINFLLSAAVIALFGTRVAQVLDRQRRALAQARERSVRDEGLLAIASLAAGAAHALNTPLSTMAVVLADLRDGLGQAPPSAHEDLELLSRQVDACRRAVRELVAEAQPESSPPPRQPLGARIEQAVTRWRLLRPSVDLQMRIDPAAATLPVRVDRGLDYLLINLLDNAADAARSSGARSIGLDVGVHAPWLRIDVTDPGSGTPPAPPRAFASDKPEGLGLGLALASRICERHAGRLGLEHDPHGTRVRAEMALTALDAA